MAQLDPVTKAGIVLSTKVKGFINLFTVIETVTLTVWLVLADPSSVSFIPGLAHGLDALNPFVRTVIAIVVLYFGLLLEHTTATKAGVLAGYENPHPE